MNSAHVLAPTKNMQIPQFVINKSQTNEFFDHLGFLFSGSLAGLKYYTDLNSSLTEKVDHTIKQRKNEDFCFEKICSHQNQARRVSRLYWIES